MTDNLKNLVNTIIIMATYPEICVSCGNTDRAAFTKYDYKWRRQDPAYAGSDTYKKEYVLKVRFFLCPKCKQQAMTRFTATLAISLTVTLLGMALTFGAFTDDMELWGLIFVVPAIATLIFTALLRRHLSAYSIKVRFSNNLFYPKFKSKLYQQEFDRVNPKGIPPSGVINTTIYRM